VMDSIGVDGVDGVVGVERGGISDTLCAYIPDTQFLNLSFRRIFLFPSSFLFSLP
jgi:hypothetical protein